jgi:hypothetical protein
MSRRMKSAAHVKPKWQRRCTLRRQAMERDHQMSVEFFGRETDRVVRDHGDGASHRKIG